MTIANTFRSARKLAPLLLAPSVAALPQSGKPATTTVLLTITSPTTMYYGQTVDGSAQVSSSDGSTPTGTITFYDGTISICVLTITPGATCPASAGEGFAAGTHNLTAAYSGDATHSASTSNPATLTVLKDSTAAALTSSANPATAGQNLTLTATIQGAHANPTGNVTFYDGGNMLATGTLNPNGTAIYTTNSLSPGTHSLTAVFGGSENFQAVVSPDLNQVIQPAPTPPASPASFSIDVDSVSVEAGETVSIPITFANGAMQLTCSNLPDEATCSFTPNTRAGTSALTLKTSAPRDCGTSTPYVVASLPYTTPLAAGLLLLLAPKRRYAWRRLLMICIAAGALGTTIGCGTGNCTDLGTRPGTYKISVTGTSGGTPQAVITREVLVKVTI